MIVLVQVGGTNSRLLAERRAALQAMNAPDDNDNLRQTIEPELTQAELFPRIAHVTQRDEETEEYVCRLQLLPETPCEKSLVSKSQELGLCVTRIARTPEKVRLAMCGVVEGLLCTVIQ